MTVAPSIASFSRDKFRPGALAPSPPLLSVPVVDPVTGVSNCQLARPPAATSNIRWGWIKRTEVTWISPEISGARATLTSNAFSVSMSGAPVPPPPARLISRTESAGVGMILRLISPLIANCNPVASRKAAIISALWSFQLKKLGPITSPAINIATKTAKPISSLFKAHSRQTYCAAARIHSRNQTVCMRSHIA